MYLTIGPTYLPDTRLSIEELAGIERFVKEAAVLRSTDGFSEVPVGRDGDNVDYAVRAWRLLCAATNCDADALNSVFMLGQMEDAGWERLPTFRFAKEAALAQSARVIQFKSGNGIATLDAIALAASAIAYDPSHRVALVAAEKVNARFVRRRIGSQVFGDAAIASIAASERFTDQALTVTLVGRPVTLNDPRFFEVRPGGLLGDLDFVASAQRLSHQVIKLALERANVQAADINVCCTQNLSERLWQHIEAAGPLPGKPLRRRDKFAHAPSVDLLANLSVAWSERQLPRGSLVLLLSLGMGLGASSCIFHVD